MLNVLLIFGGVSPEHEISVISARTILSSLNPEKYSPILLGISKTGKWRSFTTESFSTVKLVEDNPEKENSVLFDVSKQQGIIIDKTFFQVDCAFPILHGKGGEDGSIQGFSAYPNPITNKSFTVKTSNSSNKKVTIFNVLGKKVFSTTFSGVQKTVNIATLNSGIYILKVIEDGKSSTKKLVIK